MKKIKNILAFIGLAFLSGFLVQAVMKSGTNPPDSTTKQIPRDSIQSVVGDYVYALPLPDHLSFAGERVPLENPDIRERMDRELLVNAYWQSNGLLLLKRANKYFPIITPILRANGIPEDFKYLAVAESGLLQAVSPAGAKGFWQFMPSTGKEYGLEVNGNVDERYNIEKSTIAACKYLKKAKDKLGSWTLAAAAYNAGRTGITRQQKRQKVSDYYDLLLGNETSRYVFRILALKEVLEHPKKYGFHYSKSDLYPRIPTYSVEVDSVVKNFADFAKDFGINYKILKIYNPWLREDHLNNKSHKRYSIKIPKKGYYSYKP